MLDFQQKRKIRSAMYSRLSLGILLVVSVFFLHSTWGVYSKKRLSEEEKQLSLKNVEELRERSVDLKSKMEELDTEQGIEKEIRSRFSVAKEDEKIVVILEDNENKVSTSTTKDSFWQKIRDFFGF